MDEAPSNQTPARGRRLSLSRLRPGLLREGDWLLTVGLIYAIHFVFTHLFVRRVFPDIQVFQPFSWLPAHVFTAWDGGWYRDLFVIYDSYIWPPGYIFALRGIDNLFQFDWMGFEKSAVLVNLLSHLVAVRGLYLYTAGFPVRAGGAPVAPWLVASLVLFYPGNNTFFASYAESLFLAVTVWAFVWHQRGQILVASALAGLSCLVRTQGAFLCVALVLEQLWVCFRGRSFEVRRLASASVGLLVFLGWNIYVLMQGTDVFAVRHSWVEELVAVHVPEGMSPRLWTLQYLAVSPNKEFFFFWMFLATAAYCWWRGRPLEALYIGVFYSALLVTTLRPFSWVRWASTLFPWAVMFADFLRGKPRLQVALLLVFIAASLFFQTMYFTEEWGEI